MLLRINAGFLLFRANPCITYLSLLIDEDAVVTATGLHHFFVVTAFYLSPDCLGSDTLNLGKSGCGYPQNKRLWLFTSDIR